MRISGKVDRPGEPNFAVKSWICFCVCVCVYLFLLPLVNVGETAGTNRLKLCAWAFCYGLQYPACQHGPLTDME